MVCVMKWILLKFEVVVGGGSAGVSELKKVRVILVEDSRWKACSRFAWLWLRGAVDMFCVAFPREQV